MASSKPFKNFIFLILFDIFCCTYTQQYLSKKPEVGNDTDEVKPFHRTAVVDGDLIVFRIRNGRPVKLGDVPYQVALMLMIDKKMSKYSTYCGGTIIGPKKILTAAHCVERKRLSDCCKGSLRSLDFDIHRAVAGQLKTVTRYGLEGQWRKIISGKYPPKYKFPNLDVAVLYLGTAFKYNNVVQRIAYASKDIDYEQECLVTGHGNIQLGGRQSEILLQAHLRTLPKSKCRKLQDIFKHTDTLICTSDENSDTAEGDSGGPLVCKGTGDPAEANSERGIVAGIVSGGRTNIKSGSFFTRVSTHYKFISCASRLEATTWILSLVILFQLST